MKWNDQTQLVVPTHSCRVSILVVRTEKGWGLTSSLPFLWPACCGWPNLPQWSVVEQSFSWLLSSLVAEFLGSALGLEIAKMAMSAGVSSQTQNGCGTTTSVLSPMVGRFDEGDNGQQW